MQKSPPAAYRADFKEELFRQMTREINQYARCAIKPQKKTLWNLFQPVDLRLLLKAVAVPAVIILAGTCCLMDSMTSMPADDGQVILFQPSSNRDYIMGHQQNAVNYIARASSSQGSFSSRPDVRAGDLRQESLKLSATNNG